MTTIISFLSVALTVWAIPYLVSFFDDRAKRRQKQKKYLIKFYKLSELKRCRTIREISIKYLEKEVDFSNN
jgi:hypothetical protein